MAGRGGSLNVIKEGLVYTAIFIVIIAVFLMGFWNIIAPTGVSPSVVQTECGAAYGSSVIASAISAGLAAYSVYRSLRSNRFDDVALFTLVLAILIYALTAYSLYNFTSGLC